MKTLIKLGVLSCILTLASTFMGCTTAPKTWGNARYVETSYEPQFEHHYNEGLDEYDQRRLLSAVIGQLEKCPNMRRNSVYMLSNFEQQTPDTQIDVQMLNRELNDRLTSSGYTVIDKSSRPEIFNEMQYQSTGYTAPHLAAVKGRQAGVEYLVRAVISAKSQNTDKVKTVRYRMSLQTVHLENSTVVCAPAVEIKKQYERTRKAF